MAVPKFFEGETGLVYAGALGLLASDLIPTPADAIYFSIDKKLRDAWKKGTISAERYWLIETLSYYGLNPLWWGLVFGATVLTQGEVDTKLKILLSLVGGGAVIGVLLKNVHQDAIAIERQQARKKKKNKK